MQQNPITVITKILPDKLEELKTYLEPIGLDIKNKTSQVISFAAYKHLHYCTFFVIPGDHPSPGSSPAPPLLVFEANIDGEVKAFVNELIKKDPKFVDKVYSCCAGYPGSDAGQLAAYLLANDQGANAFYVAHPGQNLNTIYRQREIRGHIEKFIDENRNELQAKQPAEIKDAVVKYLESLDHYKNGIPKIEEQPFLNKYGDKIFNFLKEIVTCKLTVGFFCILLAAGLLEIFGGVIQGLIFTLLLALTSIVILFRSYEKSDKQDNRAWTSSEQMRAIQQVEDRQLQNHLTSVIEIKSGLLRLTTLRIVLAGINLVAKVVATKGILSGIVTIHFARWVILPGDAGGRRRLLFMSNYDGSWENYLGEFIDHASVGLTAVWSNTQQAKDRGFPDTQWLALRGGSRDEQRFKNFARNSQLPELVWYSAYTDLSVKNIDNNRRIHAGLFSTADLAAWLKCL